MEEGNQIKGIIPARIAHRAHFFEARVVSNPHYAVGQPNILERYVTVERKQFVRCVGVQYDCGKINGSSRIGV